MTTKSAENHFKTPVLFLIYKRPLTTLKVFEKIKEIRPQKLYIAADGPKQGEEKICDETRKIVENITWNCEVKQLFRKENLGCKLSVSYALEWFFESEEMGIILEDDCLPDISFFGFCEKLLSKYNNNTRVMMISGTNYFPPNSPVLHKYSYSYYFSRYYSIWGWATWKRAWQLYDPEMKEFYTLQKKAFFKKMLPDNRMSQFFENIFSDVKEKNIDTWDYQWAYTCLINNALSISPVNNLISNIGYTGTRDNTSTKSKACGRPTQPININNMLHPPDTQWNSALDKILWDILEKYKPEKSKFTRKIREFRKKIKKYCRIFKQTFKKKSEIKKTKLHQYAKKSFNQKVKQYSCSRETLTLVIPCFGHAKFLNTTLQSLIHQTRKPDEIIFVNDASPDSTYKILSDFKNSHPDFNIVILSNPTNMGQSQSLNAGIFSSNSDLVMILNDDDYLMHNAVEITINLMQKYSDIHLLGFSCELFTSNISITKYNKIAKLNYNNFVIRTPNNICEYTKYNDINMTHSGSTFTKYAWDTIGGYFSKKHERLVPFSDRDFQLRLNCYFSIGIFPDTKMAFWRNGSSVDKKLGLRVNEWVIL